VSILKNYRSPLVFAKRKKEKEKKKKGRKRGKKKKEFDEIERCRERSRWAIT